MMPRWAWIVCGIAVAMGLASAVGSAWWMVRTGFANGQDHVFGDQHLKTAVALIELHRIRNGRYPEDLRELEHLGQWDPMHVKAVAYCADAAGTAYKVEVVRGWIAKPRLEVPPEFWRGTGYRGDLGCQLQ